MEAESTIAHEPEGNRFTESDKAIAYLVHLWLRDNQRARASQKIYQMISASRQCRRSALSWKRKIENYVACATGEGPTGGADRKEYPELVSRYSTSVDSARVSALIEVTFPNEEIRNFYSGLGFKAVELPAVTPLPDIISDFGMVTRSGVERAANVINQSGVPKGFSESIDYDVLINGKPYPPKAIIGLAFMESTGLTIDGSRFKGGLETPCFKTLEKVGFKILPKKLSKPSQRYTHRIISSVSAKPFLVLAGGTGTGKTLAAKLQAIAISGDENVEVIAVGADWADNRHLLGFRNLLAEDGNTYVAPAALRMILKASCNPRRPHFLILDEMNLSHVERYFADFLSSMESKEPLKLHDSPYPLNTEDSISIPGKIAYPDNLFVIGTVNIDETTYMFSPKVLDRAHVIEFKVTWNEIASGLKGDAPCEFMALSQEQVDEFMRVSQLSEKNLTGEEHRLLTEVLEDLHAALDGTRFVFAHRTVRECLNFVASAQALAKVDIITPQDTKTLIDMTILQKALPKLNGASGTLSKVLEDLIKVADKHDLNLCKEKLESMRRQLKADQFVSFIN